MSKYLLVFGSLRKNSKRGYNHDRFGKGTQKYIKDVELKGYEMYNLGAYPAICEGKNNIKCELHEVQDTAFEQINMMEIYAGYTPLKIKLDKKITATIYVMNKERLINYSKVIDGDWN